MGAFMVERNLMGISMEALASAQAAAIAKTEGTEVTYVRSTFVPEDGRCFCLFKGPDAARRSRPSTTRLACPTAL